MPDVTQANSYLLGVHKQSAEGTVGTVAAYTVPVYGERAKPVYDVGTIAVTDANAVAGDTFKKPSSWNLEGVTMPAFDNILGMLLVGLWPTDAATGTAPSRIHAFSGLGAAQPWHAFFGLWPNAAKEHTFGKGHITGLSFSSTQDGGPLEVGVSAMGQTVTDENSTATTAVALTDGYFALQAASSYIRADVDTPNSVPGVALAGVRNISIAVNRSASAEPTADSASVTNINPGAVSIEVSMEWLFQNWDAFNTSYFGSAAGTTLSGAHVTGALEVFWKHSLSATSTFKLYIPSMVFAAEMPQPNPEGSALTFAVTGRVHKPTTGDHVVPTLTNNVTPAY